MFGAQRSLRKFALAVTCGALTLGTLATTSSPSAAQTGEPEWLQVVNAYRTSSGLPRLTQDTDRMGGVAKHSVYLAMTGSMTHGEDPSSPFYTPEGATAAAKSVLGGWRGAIRSDRNLIDGWMTAPFHALHFFEPRLQRIAYASTHGLPGASLDSAAVLDIIHGLGAKVLPDRPITFPAHGSTTPLTSFVAETPNPLTSCPGYSAPAGLPLFAMFTSAPGAATASLTVGGSPVETCLIDTNYQNPDGAAQAVGRALLAQKRAVIIVPRQPLIPGSSYTARVATASAGTVEWSFVVQAEGSALPGPAATPLVLQAPVKASTRVSAPAKVKVLTTRTGK